MLRSYFIIFIASILLTVIYYLYDQDANTVSISHMLLVGSVITFGIFIIISLIFFTITRPSFKFLKKEFKKRYH